MMVTFVALVSLFMIGIGLFSPAGLAFFVSCWQSPGGLWMAAMWRSLAPLLKRGWALLALLMGCFFPWSAFG